MAVLAERYMRDYVPSHCRASSAEVYRRALDNHILPALGEMRVGEVGREQVMELHYAMRGEPYAANAVLKIVAKMLSLAVEWGLREHQRPAHVVALGPEDMLDADPNRRTGLVALLLALAQRLVAAALAMDPAPQPFSFSTASISAER